MKSHQMLLVGALAALGSLFACRSGQAGDDDAKVLQGKMASAVR